MWLLHQPAESCWACSTRRYSGSHRPIHLPFWADLLSSEGRVPSGSATVWENTHYTTQARKGTYVQWSACHREKDNALALQRKTHRRFWLTLKRMHWSTTELDNKACIIPECFYRALWIPWLSWHCMGFMEFTDRGKSVVRFLAGCLRTCLPLINNLHQIKSENVTSDNGLF